MAALTVAACSSSSNSQTDPNSAAADGSNGSPLDATVKSDGSDDNGLVFGVGKGPKQKDSGGNSDGSGIGVNAFLWRGALDTISFMPVASADPFGGVIITDWYTPPGTSGERFKATIYILSKELRSDGIRVNIYRQVLQNGQWIDAPVSDSTVGDIENKVLARARHMREQQKASG